MRKTKEINYLTTTEAKDRINKLVMILHARAAAGEKDLCVQCFLNKIAHYIDRIST